MKTYNDKMHSLGRIFGAIVLIGIFIVPIAVCTVYDIFPPVKILILGIGMVCMVYAPVTIAEFFTYTPMLGTGGSYLVFTTGNLTNLKIPCAITTMENANVKPGSEEGEVFATLAIAASSIVTTIIIFVGMLAVVPVVFVAVLFNLVPSLLEVAGALIPVMGIVSIIAARIMYKTKFITSMDDK